MIVAPIADQIDITILGGKGTARILALLLLLALCFVAGLFARTKTAKRIKDWLEDNVLSMLPFYTLLKGMSETAAGMNSHYQKDVVLINIEEVWQIGFLMEEIDDELNAVFIPGAPNPLAGSVVFVKDNRLKRIDLEEINAMQIHRKLGEGTRKYLKGKISKDSFQEKG